MTTQDLNTLQEIADLLRSGKIVYVEVTRADDLPTKEFATIHFLFLSLYQFERVIAMDQYKDIKILYPEKFDETQALLDIAKRL